MVIDYCFNEKGFTTLWGDYFPSNPASGRVMEKCGFVDTGEETLCPNLEVGSDCPVRVMQLKRTLTNNEERNKPSREQSCGGIQYVDVIAAAYGDIGEDY